MGGTKLSTERVIHFAMFILLLAGLCGITAWTCYTNITEHFVLQYASIAFVWGIILAILYLGFKKLGWDWWS
ncbi:hypothetical protein DRO34_00930 [Candidatus Bathyarchaeota archaeon]|nr:MAG: hypothetical protein DRO34_00930 [Candidatus Bathyarchaeota archaeon]